MKDKVMNELSPHMIYKKTQASAVPELNDVHDLIHVTLKELHRSLAVLNERPAFGSDVHNNHASRALTAVYVLQVSLDFERGGDIATNLFKLYEYCRNQLVAATTKDENADIATALAVVSELLDAWKRIK
jgi:flagellar protein FliS